MGSATSQRFPPEVPLPAGAHPAPPVPVVYDVPEVEGISLRVYAAIQLRVPDSGIDWLDNMIRQARKLDEKQSGSRRRLK